MEPTRLPDGEVQGEPTRGRAVMALREARVAARGHRTAALVFVALSLAAAVACVGAAAQALPSAARTAYVYDSPSAATTSPADVSSVALRVYDPPMRHSGANIVVALGASAAEEAGGGAEVAFGPAPENAWSTFDRVQAEGSPFPGYKGGGTFANDGRAGSQILPP